jgi:hypothetical protein
MLHPEPTRCGAQTLDLTCRSQANLVSQSLVDARRISGNRCRVWRRRKPFGPRTECNQDEVLRKWVLPVIDTVNDRCQPVIRMLSCRGSRLGHPFPRWVASAASRRRPWRSSLEASDGRWRRRLQQRRTRDQIKRLDPATVVIETRPSAQSWNDRTPPGPAVASCRECAPGLLDR